MTYTQPMVMVFQEYESTSSSTKAAELPACIVGPCYHIVDPTEDEILALVGTYTEAGIVNGMFPNNAPGALISEDSVSFRFKNAIVKTHTGKSPATVNAFVRNEITFETKDFLSDVEVGDYVDILDNTDPLAIVPLYRELRVTGVNVDTGVVMVNRTLDIATDPASVLLNFARKIDDFFLDGTAAGVHLDVTSEKFDVVGVQYTINGVPSVVTSAELYVGYKALRQDLSDVFTIYDAIEIEGRLGKIVPENPLAFGVSIAMANAPTGIRCVGVDSEDLIGYTDAKDRLENQDPIYAIVPLTTSPEVLSMFKMHCLAMSDPSKGRWRITIGTQELVTKKQITTGVARLSDDGDGDFVVLTSSTDGISFISSDVDAGDRLVIRGNDGAEYTYTVSSVPSEDMLTIMQSAPFDPMKFTKNDVDYTFEIWRDLDKLAQATEIANTAKAYGTSRYVSVWPDKCRVGERILPAYYVACALAGGIAGLPSHYGFTRLSIAGITSVLHSSDYFNQEQLDVIAGGGNMIFTQTSENSPPYIRHQLTSDMSTLEFQELSFVKNFDYVSYICRDTMDEFLGKYNINQSTLNTLRTALNAILETLKLDNQPRIGSRILDYKVTKVEQLKDVRDRVEMYAEVAFPYPLNTIGLHLRSVFLQVVSS